MHHLACVLWRHVLLAQYLSKVCNRIGKKGEELQHSAYSDLIFSALLVQNTPYGLFS